MLSHINIDWTKVDQPDIVLQRFASRRSQVYGTKGIVSSSQPLATAAGLEILRKGGNAGEHRSALFQTTGGSHHRKILADAAVATSAALNVTEPSSCGIGG